MAASINVIGLSIIVAPQVILRSVSFGSADNSIYGVLLAGFIVFGLTFYALRIFTQANPRRSIHQVAARYIGGWAGLFVAAARILAYALVVVLGVELIVASLNTFLEIESWMSWIAAGLILVLALPVMLDRFFGRLTWIALFTVIGVAGLAVILFYGLAQELIGSIDFSSVLSARRDALEAELNTGRYFPYLEGTLGACLSAAILILLSERILVKSDERRAGSRRLLAFFVPSFLLVALSVYFIVLLQMPGRRLGVPALSMAFAFFGENGQIVAAVLFSSVGMAATYASYRQLPRLLRELAIDGLLPRRLAAQDASRPRRLIVALIALLAAIVTSVLDSTRSIAIVLIFVCFVIALLASLAMMFRSRSILNDSTSADERRRATGQLWIFLGFGLLSLAILIAVSYAQPLWALAGLIWLAVPGLFLWTYRRGQGRVSEVLAVSDSSQSRRVPTRVRGYVLVERFDQPALKAISWARAARLSSLEAVCVDVDPNVTRGLREEWERARLAIPLTILGTPKGAVRGPFIEHIRMVRKVHANDVVMVFIPRLISTGSWERFYVRHTTPKIISELRLEQGVMVTEVPYRLDVSGPNISDDAEEQYALESAELEKP